MELLLFILAKYTIDGNIFRFEAYINYLFVAIAGSICAKLNIYNRIRFELLKNSAPMLKIILFFLATAIILGTRKASPFFMDWVLVPMYVFVIINIDILSLIDSKRQITRLN